MTKKAVIRIMVYNQDKYLAQCLESVMHQSEEDIDILVVDNGSTDRTKSIVEQYQKFDSRIHYVRNEKKDTPTFDELIVLETTYEVLLDPSYADYYMDLSPNRSMTPDFIKEAEKYFGADMIIGKPTAFIDDDLFTDTNQKTMSSKEFELLYYAINEDVGVLYKTTMAKGVLDICNKYYPELGISELKKALALLCELQLSINMLRENTCHALDAFDTHPEFHIDVDSTSFLEGCSKFNNLGSRVIDLMVTDKDAAFTFISHGYEDCYRKVLNAADDRDPNFKMNLVKNLIMYHLMDNVALSKDEEYLKDTIKRYLGLFAKDELLLSHFTNFVSRWYLMEDSDDEVLKSIFEYTLLTDDSNPYNFGTSMEGKLQAFDLRDFVNKWNVHDPRIDDILLAIKVGNSEKALKIDSAILLEKPFNHEAITFRLMLDTNQHNQRVLKSLENYIFHGASASKEIKQAQEANSQPMLKPHKSLFS